jgi:creatinine amidohydrolase
MFGAYEIVGRLDDIPLNLTEPMPVHPADPGIDNLFPLGPSSGTIGFYMSDAIDHQGAAIPVTAEQRDQMTKEGVAQIEDEVKNFDINGILQAMRDHDKFTQDEIASKYGWMFPTK